MWRNPGPLMWRACGAPVTWRPSQESYSHCFYFGFGLKTCVVFSSSSKKKKKFGLYYRKNCGTREQLVFLLLFAEHGSGSVFWILIQILWDTEGHGILVKHGSGSKLLTAKSANNFFSINNDELRFCEARTSNSWGVRILVYWTIKKTERLFSGRKE